MIVESFKQVAPREGANHSGEFFVSAEELSERAQLPLSKREMARISRLNLSSVRTRCHPSDLLANSCATLRVAAL